MGACLDESPLAIYNMVGDRAIPQGADWDVVLKYKENDVAIDFSSCTAVMQVRKDYDKEVILELSSIGGTIVLGSGIGDTPNVILKFTHQATSAMTEYYGIYDVEVTTPAGLVYKFIKGKFELEREVTK